MRKQLFNVFILEILMNFSIPVKAQESEQQPCHYWSGGWRSCGTFDKKNVVGYVGDGLTACEYMSPNGINEGTTYYFSGDLILSDFYFSIPRSATIVGYTVYLVKWGNSGNMIKDLMVKLTHNGSAIGANKKKTSFWTSSPEQYNYGTPYSLWGTSLTPVQVNDASFGVKIQCQNYDHYNHAYAYVDFCSITVYYKPDNGSMIKSQERNEMLALNKNVHPTPDADILNSFKGYHHNFNSLINTNIRKLIIVQSKADTNQLVKRIEDVSFRLSSNYFIILASKNKRKKLLIG